MSRHFKTVDGIKFRKNWACKDCGTSVKPIRFHKVTETGVILASQYMCPVSSCGRRQASGWHEIVKCEPHFTTPNGAPPSGGNPTVLKAA